MAILLLNLNNLKMKKVSFFAALSIIVMFMTSCASTSRTGVIAPFARTEVYPNEIRAEVDLSEKNKVEGNSKQWYILGYRISGGNKFFEDKSVRTSMFGKRTNLAQSSAMYNALESGDYDIIANPQYKNVVHRWLFGIVKRYDVTVTGYGGKVKKLYQHTEPTPYRAIQ